MNRSHCQSELTLSACRLAMRKMITSVKTPWDSYSTKTSMSILWTRVFSPALMRRSSYRPRKTGWLVSLPRAVISESLNLRKPWFCCKIKQSNTTKPACRISNLKCLKNARWSDLKGITRSHARLSTSYAKSLAMSLEKASKFLESDTHSSLIWARVTSWSLITARKKLLDFVSTCRVTSTCRPVRGSCSCSSRSRRSVER